jgi:hypothetical protein
MRFRTYILLALAGLWFTIGGMFFYRSCWDLVDLKKHTGPVIELGITEFDTDLHLFSLNFKLDGNPETFGVYQKKNQQYSDLLNLIKVGDTATVFYGEWRQKEGMLNLQVTHLETTKHVIVDYTVRKYRDRWIGLILIGLSFAVGGLAWYLFKKYPKAVEDNSLMTL